MLLNLTINANMKYLIPILLAVSVVSLLGLAFWAVIPKAERPILGKKITIQDVIVDDTYPANQFEQLNIDMNLHNQLRKQGLNPQGKDLHEAVNNELKKNGITEYTVKKKVGKIKINKL